MYVKLRIEKCIEEVYDLEEDKFLVVYMMCKKLCNYFKWKREFV